MEIGSAPEVPLPRPLLSLKPSFSQRATALIEVVLCSDFPTQIVIGGLMLLSGFPVRDAQGTATLGFVIVLSLVDSLALIGLMWVFLKMHGERPRDLFLGWRAIGPEARLGLPLVLVAFVLAATILLIVRALLPALHDVPTNPLQQLLRTPADASVFALVAIVAGGVREELQRAFLLDRFERWLGGPIAGVVVANVAFGLGHLWQGADAAVATGVLGAFWALVYLWRRSVIAPMVSHAGFNLFQLLLLIAVTH